MDWRLRLHANLARLHIEQHPVKNKQRKSREQNGSRELNNLILL